MFKIVFVDDFYYADDTVDTIFYLSFNDVFFPSNQWTDFAIIVLNWWISAIIENYKKKNAKFKLFFMDGPYYVECLKHGSVVHLSFIEEKKLKQTICEGDVEIEVLVAELISVSSEIIQAIKKHDFGELRDFNNLEKALAKLKSL